MRRVAGEQAGQAAVELVALLPLLAAVILGGWQLLLAGDAAWRAASAAQAAARALAVAGEDPRSAARAVLPPRLERGLRVKRSGEVVEVSLRVPAVLAGWSPGRVGARAAFPGQG